MAYQRYIKVGGKLYGPYFYESKREGDKVVSTYIKPKELATKIPSVSVAQKSNQKKWWQFWRPFVMIIVLGLLFSLTLHPSSPTTGMVVSTAHPVQDLFLVFIIGIFSALILYVFIVFRDKREKKRDAQIRKTIESILHDYRKSGLSLEGDPDD